MYLYQTSSHFSAPMRLHSSKWLMHFQSCIIKTKRIMTKKRICMLTSLREVVHIIGYWMCRHHVIVKKSEQQNRDTQSTKRDGVTF